MIMLSGLKEGLKQTDTGVYYIHEYIPLRKRSYYPTLKAQISEDIYQYKMGDDNAMDFFTNELMWAISAISRNISGDKIGLIAVPPSKVGKESSIKKSIQVIMNWYSGKLTKLAFECDKVIYDYGNLLTRVSDISTAHEGRRASYDEQKESISCSRDHLSKYWTTFIILDDVTTIGTSMDVCRDILIEHGAIERYIYRLAIGRTV